MLIVFSFLSVCALCFLLGWVQWRLNRCTNNQKHNWKRVDEKYYGDKVVPDMIILHLKCKNCGKEIKKTYQI